MLMNMQTTPILRLLTFSNYLQTTYNFPQTTSSLPQFSKDYFHFKTTPIFRTLPDHSQFLNYTQNIPIFILLTTTTQTTPNPLIFSDYSNSQINQDYSHFIHRHRDYSLSQITLKLFLFSDYSQTLSSLRTPTPTGNHLALSQISQRLLAPISNYSHTMPPLTSGMLACCCWPFSMLL